MSVLERPPDATHDAPHRGSVAVAATEAAPSIDETAMIEPAEAAEQVAAALQSRQGVEPPLLARLDIRAQLQRFERLTAILGMLFLIAGLAVWRFKPHSDFRLALLILVCAMFLAILHHYSLEENRRSNSE